MAKSVEMTAVRGFVGYEVDAEGKKKNVRPGEKFMCPEQDVNRFETTGKAYRDAKQAKAAQAEAADTPAE